MGTLRYLYRRLRAFRRSGEIHSEIAEELSFHIALRTEENIRRGMSPDQARREAERRFGRMSRIKEEGYDVRGGRWLETTWQDLRYSGRMLVKAPGFTTAAVLSLALGIGANTAIFSLADKVLMRKLPVEEPDRLVVVTVDNGSAVPGTLSRAMNYPDFADHAAGNQVFEGLVCFTHRAVTLNEAGQSERLQGAVVSGNYFAVLGVRPALGRGFLAEEDRALGTHPVAVLSHGLWQRRFGGDPAVVGRTVSLNSVRFTIVGVAPSEFTGTVPGIAPDVYLPIMMMGAASPSWSISGAFGFYNRGSGWLEVIGRLKPGVSREQATTAMTLLGSQIAKANPGSNGTARVGPRFVLEDGSRGNTALLRELRFPLQMLMATVGLILLIASANVANLLLARAGARHQEIAVRLAIGAGRARLVRQLLTESVMLSALGGAAGLALAAATSGMVAGFTPPSQFTTWTLENQLDMRVLGFALTVSLLTGILFGLAPALSASRPDLLSAVKGESPLLGKSVRRLSLRNLLVVAQVAFSVIVLVGAGLCVRSLRQLQAIDAGFDPARVLVMSLDLSLSGYDRTRGMRFYSELIERVRRMRGVEAVSLATQLPLVDEGGNSEIRVEGYPTKPGENLIVDFNMVAPDYFRTMKIPLVAGREFSPSDSSTAPQVVIINETAARLFWSGRDPVGRRLSFPRSTPNDTRQIVGVVKDSKNRRLNEEVRPAVYRPSTQQYSASLTLHVRSAGEPTALIAGVRREVQALDASLPIFNIKTLEEQKSNSLYTSRMAATLLTVFGLLALLLAAVGLYGVMAYAVNSRRREIGIRMALGARSEEVRRQVIAEGIAMVTIGSSLGLAGAVAATRLLESLLYGVTTTDPISFAGAALLLLTVALMASYVPARRASRTDPVLALKV